MSNIGLVTFSSTLDNYGQVLQALATQEYLKRRGHVVYLVRRHRNLKDFFTIKFRFWLAKTALYLSLFKSKKDIFITIVNGPVRIKRTKEAEKIHPRFFEEFRKTHFNIISDTVSDIKDYRISVLCAGSDQIWSGRSAFYHLQFGPQSLKRIAIGPSTGNRIPSNLNRRKMKKWLKSFSLITTREDSGVDYCKSFGIANIKRVLDPVFLLSENDFDRFAGENIAQGGYLFVYLLNSQISLSYCDIENFAIAHGLAFKYVTAQGRYDEYEKVYASIPEWLALLNNASYVITNSFHGMAMSIIYRKKFLVLPLIGKEKKTNERIETVASEMGLMDRIFRDDLSVVFKDIDYSLSEVRIRENKDLLDSLMKVANL